MMQDPMLQDQKENVQKVPNPQDQPLPKKKKIKKKKAKKENVKEELPAQDKVQPIAQEKGKVPEKVPEKVQVFNRDEVRAKLKAALNSKSSIRSSGASNQVKSALNKLNEGEASEQQSGMEDILNDMNKMKPNDARKQLKSVAAGLEDKQVEPFCQMIRTKFPQQANDLIAQIKQARKTKAAKQLAKPKVNPSTVYKRPGDTDAEQVQNQPYNVEPMEIKQDQKESTLLEQSQIVQAQIETTHFQPVENDTSPTLAQELNPPQIKPVQSSSLSSNLLPKPIAKKKKQFAPINIAVPKLQEMAQIETKPETKLEPKANEKITEQIIEPSSKKNKKKPDLKSKQEIKSQEKDLESKLIAKPTNRIDTIKNIDDLFSPQKDIAVAKPEFKCLPFKDRLDVLKKFSSRQATIELQQFMMEKGHEVTLLKLDRVERTSIPQTVLIPGTQEIVMALPQAVIDILKAQQAAGQISHKEYVYESKVIIGEDKKERQVYYRQKNGSKELEEIKKRYTKVINWFESLQGQKIPLCFMDEYLGKLGIQQKSEMKMEDDKKALYFYHVYGKELPEPQASNTATAVLTTVSAPFVCFHGIV